MKKRIYFIMISVCCLLLCACSDINNNPKIEKWDCTVICSEESREDSYIITYSEEKIISRTGTLSFQNKNDFDIVVHILTEGKEERSVEIGAGGMAVLYQVEKEIVYMVGCHADVEEGTEIKLTAFDGEAAEVNELLVGYRNYQLDDVWGGPDVESENTWIWKIDEYSQLQVSCNNKDKVVICSIDAVFQAKILEI